MIRYATFENFFWFWLVPALAGVLAYGFWSRGRARYRFVGRVSVVRLAGELSAWRAWTKALCLVGATALLIFALAQPQWGKYWTKQRAAGRDVIVAIDVSRSMLAEDVTPSRLERAKADVRDLVAAVEQAGGYRLGLIAFAGSASLKCPLTQVTSHFKLMLDALDTRSVAQGGTMIGDCIREAIEAFDEKTQNFRDFILITDGEDMDSFPHEAAAAARDAGITIYTIGLGDSQQGSRIAVPDKNGQRSYLEHQGQIVWSKLDERTLKDIAQTTGGLYIPAGTRAIELDRIFRDVIEPKSKRDMDETARERLRHRFQWFLAPAVLLLLLEMLIRDTRTKPVTDAGTASADATANGKRATESRRRGWQSALPVAGIALLLSFAIATRARADDAGSLVRDGNRLYDQRKYAEASEKFAEAAKLAPTSPVPLFNQAAALYQSGNFADAVKLYEQARTNAPDDMRQQINYALGNCHLQQAIRAQAQPAMASQEAKTATQFYRDAITAPRSRSNDSNDGSISDDARYNMELAKRLIQLMQQKQQQQQQSQERQEKDQNRDQQQRPGQQNQQNQTEDKQGEGKDDSETPQDEEKNQSSDQGQQGDSSEEQPRPANGQIREELSSDEAAERLRAAIARAQMARARRLTEQKKQAKGKAGERDW